MKLGNLLGRDGQKALYEVAEKKERLPELTINKKLQLFAIKDLNNQELVAYLKVFSEFRKEYFQTRKTSEKIEERQKFLLQREIARMDNLDKVKQQKAAAKKVWKSYKPQVASNGVKIVDSIPKEWKSEEVI